MLNKYFESRCRTRIIINQSSFRKSLCIGLTDTRLIASFETLRRADLLLLNYIAVCSFVYLSKWSIRESSYSALE